MAQLKSEPPMKSMTIKISLREIELIKLKASQYTHGNVSKWIRYAATKLEPLNEDVQSEA